MISLKDVSAHYMTSQTYAQLRKQISALETQAAALKAKEAAGVVARIKEAIATYGITQQDLFGSKQPAVKAKLKSKQAAAPKYADGKGGVWAGRGKRPRWLAEALTAGKQLEEFLVEKVKPAAEPTQPPAAAVEAAVVKVVQKTAARKAARTATTAKKSKPAATQKKTVPAAYSDGAGRTWTGRGPMPKWLKEAVAAGKPKDSFLTRA